MTSDVNTNDYPLAPQDLRQLSSLDEVRNLFDKLQYDVDTPRTAIAPERLEIDNTDIKSRIYDIHYIATDPVEQEMRVYVFNVRSVTAKLREYITSRFNERTLVILTNNYENFEFVYTKFDRRATKQVGRVGKVVVSPLSLSFSRNDPSIVVTRVLKRYTFTEEDPDFQWQKIENAYDLLQWGEDYFNNRALFSNHYLNFRLPNRREWDEEINTISSLLQKLLSTARYRFTGKKDSKIRDQYYNLIFDALGFEYDENNSSDVTEPDYFLYDPSNRATPAAVALTYEWNRNLDDIDTTERGGDTPDEIPGAKVVSIMEKPDAPDWVIVTNGRLWRLYSSNTNNKATNYYEIDLEDALQTPEINRSKAIKYWYVIFRMEAFTGFLDEILELSANFAKELRKNLKDRVFEHIFQDFARGFADNMRQQGVSNFDQATLDQVFSGTMTYLYRLMFVLYAESLDLLPLNSSDTYRQNSMDSLKKEIAELAKRIEDQAPTNIESKYDTLSTNLYERLKELFRVIDEGDDDWNMPTYNGGLFNPQTMSGQFLDQYAIPDVYLAKGIDRLARDADDIDGRLVFIDYKDLGVQQLGSIYEGLLEFKLLIADEKLAVTKEDDNEVYKPYDKVKKPLAVVEAGEIYLVNDKKERKATGSYYTPNYIVKYIVDHAVGPVLEKKFSKLRPQLDAAARDYRRYRDYAVQHDEDPEAFWKLDQPDSEMSKLLDACLNISVLDPAMGSGHFLVEVVDFVSNKLIDFLNAWTHNPVRAYIEQMRIDILRDVVTRQGISNFDENKLKPVVLLKRAVLKRCIYGVDYNMMAVELAKVSLWLDAFTLGAPLSFLDHHLKHGNSLIGAMDVSQVVAIGSVRWQRILDAATDMVRLSKRTDSTVQQVESTKAEFEQTRQKLEDVKKYANVSIAAYFVDKMKEYRKKQPGVIGQIASKAYGSSPGKTLEALFDRAQIKAEDKHFFHWKFEFPEVFLDLQTGKWNADGGFDAVVGNPPYDVISTKELGYDVTDEVKYYTDLKDFSAAIQGKNNLYKLFVNRSVDLFLSSDGNCGLIIPLAILGDRQAQGLREWILENRTFTLIDAFPQKDDPNNRVFPEAKLSTCVIIVSKNKDVSTQTQIRTHPGRDILSDSPTYHFTPKEIKVYDPRNSSIPTVDKKSWDIALNIVQSDNIAYLGDFANCYQGEVNISTHRKNITSNPNDANLLKGSQIGRYKLQPPSQGDVQWLNVNGYMEKMGSSPKAQHHKSERLVMQGISGVDDSKRLVATFCESQTFLGHSTNYFIVEDEQKLDLRYLLAILNSNFSEWRFRQTSTNNNINSYEVETLPILDIEFATDEPKRTEVAQRITDLCIKEQFDLAAEHVLIEIKSERYDVLHDVLSHLADLMMELNSELNNKIGLFVEWLETKLAIKPKSKNDKRTSADSLSGTTGRSFTEFLGDYQKDQPHMPFNSSPGVDGFDWFLDKNTSRFRVNLEDVKGEIQSKYEDTLDDTLPVRQRLERLDALVDLIIYQLYGLEDAEITTIERAQYDQKIARAKSDIQSNKTLSEDPEAAFEYMSRQVENAAQRLQALSPTPQPAIDALKSSLSNWDDMLERVQTLLIQAERDYLDTERIDYTGSAINYSKAVEVMLVETLFIPFRDAGYTDADVNNKVAFKKFMRKDRPLTLGNMPFLFSSKEKTFRSFVGTLYPDANTRIFDKTSGLRSYLTDDDIGRRNGVAHDEVTDRDTAGDARDWALAILAKL